VGVYVGTYVGVDVAIAFDGVAIVVLAMGVAFGFCFVVELHPATKADRSTIVATINIMMYLFILSLCI